MATAGISPLGPSYWMQEWGFKDYAEFDATVGPIIDGLSIYGFSLPSSAITLASWESPTTATSAYIIAQLRARQPGLDPAAQNGASSVANDLIPIVIHGKENRMAQLVIPNAFQVSINAQVGGRPITNVIGLVKSGSTAAAAAAAVLKAWKVASGPLASLPPAYVMQNVTATDISSPNGAVVALADASSGGNTSSGQISTRGACALVTFSAGTRNRSSRGRLYYGPLQESLIASDGATLDTNVAAVTLTVFQNFKTSLTNDGFTLAVLSRAHQTATPVTIVGVESTIATQRRRIRG